jgi:hypothetical protein
MKKDPTQKKSEKYGQRSEKGCWKSDGKRGKPLPEIGRKCDQPEKERGFIRIDLSVVMHENPISSGHHFFGHLGIPWLIRIPEIPAA